VKPPEKELGFGKFFTDHMFATDWSPERGWHDARIIPYAPIPLDPAAGVLHYGQAMFEGAKAFRAKDGSVSLFRVDRHCERMAHGAPRLCMPAPEPLALKQALLEFVRVEKDWVPHSPGTALYLRPTLIATEGFLGVRAATRYLLYVIASPVGAYYGGEGLKPVRIWVEREHTRATRGGLGAVKAGANYAASLLAASRAKKEGFDQVLWLDAASHAFVEEVGTMNLFAVLGDELVTPPLSDSILAGVTRESVLTLARELGLKVSQRPLAVPELMEASKKGSLLEVFGSGTAAVISPVAELHFGSEKLIINGGKVGAYAHRLFDEISGIQHRERPDRHGWLTQVP
jgi:branched-chain amino acid aminotransferase